MNAVYKRAGALSCALALTFGLAGCSGGGSAPAPEPTGGSAPSMTAEFDEAFIARSYDGERLLVVNVDVTNNDPEFSHTPMDLTYNTKAELDGESLTEAYLSSANPNFVEGNDKLDEGETGKGQLVYELDDIEEGTAKITTKVDTIDFKDTVKVLDEKIDISELEERVSESEFEVTVDEHKVGADHDGNPVLVLKVTFTNNSSKTVSFSAAVDRKFFQNGVELKPAYLGYDNPDANDELESNVGTEIQEGASLPIQLVVGLQDATSPVEYEFIDWESPDQVAVDAGELPLS